MGLGQDFKHPGRASWHKRFSLCGAWKPRYQAHTTHLLEIVRADDYYYYYYYFLFCFLIYFIFIYFLIYDYYHVMTMFRIVIIIFILIYIYICIYVYDICISTTDTLYNPNMGTYMDMVTWCLIWVKVGYPRNGTRWKADFTIPFRIGSGGGWAESRAMSQKKVVPPDWFRDAAGSFPLVIH